MKRVSGLQSRGISSEEILQRAQTDSALREELVNLLELNKRRTHNLAAAPAAQAHYAMRLQPKPYSSAHRASDL